MATVAGPVVILFGILIAALSLWGLAVPGKLLDLVRGTAMRAGGIYIAVVARLILGAALIVAAPASTSPRLFTILGWAAVVAAVGLAVMGRARLLRFIAWYEGLSPALIRIWLVFGFAFGALLVYGAP